ncbi:MAG: four helix bundle protein [Bacteroidota bacterium]
MSAIKRFEDLICWQKARLLNVEIYRISALGNFNKDYALKDQIRRASISILSNITEGFERNGNKEFIQFLTIAKASCAEVRSQLYIASDINYISKEELQNLLSIAEEVGRIISGLITHLKTSELKGIKFMEPEEPYLTKENDNQTTLL